MSRFPEHTALDLASTEVWAEWIDFDGTPTGYLISSHGRVRGKGDKRLSPFLNAYKKNCQYWRVEILVGGERRPQYVHRMVAKTFCVGYAPGLVVDHVDGDKDNNRADNLEWVTPAENVRRYHALRRQRVIARASQMQEGCPF